MGKFRRSFSKSLFLGLALLAFAAPKAATAQVGGVCYDPTVNATLTSELSATNGTLTGISSILTAMATKMDIDLTAVGGTNTNNATMVAAIIAKATDSAASTAHVEGLQAAQATFTERSRCRCSGISA